MDFPSIHFPNDSNKILVNNETFFSPEVIASSFHAVYVLAHIHTLVTNVDHTNVYPGPKMLSLYPCSPKSEFNQLILVVLYAAH